MSEGERVDREAKMRVVLEAYEAWEGDMIMGGECWVTADGLPRMTQGLYDRWIEIQNMRNRALGRFHYGKDGR
jgi:hypothetical protein